MDDLEKAVNGIFIDAFLKRCFSAFILALTKKGTALKTDFQLIAQKLRAQSYQGIPDDERETLVHLLKKLNENL